MVCKALVRGEGYWERWEVICGMLRAIWTLGLLLSLLLSACGGSGGSGGGNAGACGDLRLAGVEPSNPDLYQGQTLLLTLALVSERGFQGEVELSVLQGQQPPSWLRLSPTRTTLQIPPRGRVEKVVTLSVAPDAPLGTVSLKVGVRCGGATSSPELEVSLQANLRAPMYTFAFDNNANRQAFAALPDAVPIRGFLRVEGGPPPGEVRLEYRFSTWDGNQLVPSTDWQDGGAFALTPDQGGYQASAEVAGLWPRGLDFAVLSQRTYVTFRARVGANVLGDSKPYSIRRVDPLWLQVFPEPSVFREGAANQGMVCAVGGTYGADRDPLAWCLRKDGTPLWWVRESGTAAWAFIASTLDPAGNLYLAATPEGYGPSQVKAYRDGAPTGFALQARGLVTALAADGQNLYVGGGLYRTDLCGGSEVGFRAFVDRYDMRGSLQASYQATAEQAGEDSACQYSDANVALNSAPAEMRLVGDRLYVLLATQQKAWFETEIIDGRPTEVYYVSGAATVLRLRGSDLGVAWFWKGGGWPFGWSMYWGDSSSCRSTTRCRALTYTAVAFDVDEGAQRLAFRSWFLPFLNTETGQPLAPPPNWAHLNNLNTDYFAAFVDGGVVNAQWRNEGGRLLLEVGAPEESPPQSWGQDGLSRRRTVVLGQTGTSADAYFILRHGDELYVGGRLDGKGFLARLR